MTGWTSLGQLRKEWTCQGQLKTTGRDKDKKEKERTLRGKLTRKGHDEDMQEGRNVTWKEHDKGGRDKGGRDKGGRDKNGG